MPTLPAWLLGIIQINSLTSQWDHFSYDEAIGRLRRFNLLRSDGDSPDSVTMHPLIQWRTSKEMEDDQWLHWYAVLMVGIAYRLNSEKKTVSLRRDLAFHLPSVSMLPSALGAFKHEERMFAYYEFGKIWEREQRLQEAETCLKMALAEVQETLELPLMDQRRLLAIQLLLARTYGKRGQRREEERLLEDVVSRYTLCFGINDPDALKARNRLGNTYLYHAQPQKALPLCKETYQHTRESLGPRHEDTLWAARILARALSDMGRFNEAETLQREALELAHRIPTIGPDSPFALFIRSDLSSTQQHQGRLEEAMDLAIVSFEGLVRSYGKDSLLVQRCKDNMAKIYAKQGLAETALSHAEEVVETVSRCFGKYHDMTATYSLTLADILWASGRREEAHDLVERAVKVLSGTYDAEAEIVKTAAEIQDSMAKAIEDDCFVPTSTSVDEVRMRTSASISG